MRKGYIRCISCAHIFDGYEAVVSGGEAQATPALSRPAPSRSETLTPASGSPPRVASTPIPSVLRQRQVKTEPAFTAAPGSFPSRVTAADPVSPVFSISKTPQVRNDALHQDPIFRIDEPGHVGTDPHVVRGYRPEPVLGSDRNIIAPNEPRISGLLPEAPRAGGAPQMPAHVYVEPRAGVGTDDHRVTSDLLNTDVPRYHRVAAVFWGALILVGVLLLLAQLAYVYRAQIAHQIPALRPLLTQACAQLNCEVPYSRRIELISIMSSSLRASTKPADAEADSMTLQLTLRNTYDKPQEWPTLVLDLTDFSGTVVVRRNLPPASYLTPEVLRQPFAASSEVVVGLPIGLNGLKINGYQLGKFFP